MTTPTQPIIFFYFYSQTLDQWELTLFGDHGMRGGSFTHINAKIYNLLDKLVKPHQEMIKIII